MPAAVTYPHIRKAPGEPAALERVPRIRVAQLAMDYLSHGWTVEEMCRHHPYLQRAEAYAAMAYYHDHQEEIDGEIRAELKQAGKGHAEASQSPWMIALRERFQPAER